MPVHTYSNWNTREADQKEQIEPFRKYFILCEGVNTEIFYFKKLIDIRKDLGIHQSIDICLWEKTGKDKDISYARYLVDLAMKQKEKQENHFNPETDKIIIVFDADIFEEKVSGYNDIIEKIEENDIAAVTNPAFELFLLLHIQGSYEQYIKGHEQEYFVLDEKRRYSHAYNILRDIKKINSKKNPQIGELAQDVRIAIQQEKYINQDIHQIKGRVTSNIGAIIESILNETPDI